MFSANDNGNVFSPTCSTDDNRSNLQIAVMFVNNVSVFRVICNIMSTKLCNACVLMVQSYIRIWHIFQVITHLF